MTCRPIVVNTREQMEDYKENFPPPWELIEEQFCFKAVFGPVPRVCFVIKVKDQICSQ
jgi:hypothetical protein